MVMFDFFLWMAFTERKMPVEFPIKRIVCVYFSLPFV